MLAVLAAPKDEAVALRRRGWSPGVSPGTAR
jgi:hypothetical protein